MAGFGWRRPGQRTEIAPKLAQSKMGWRHFAQGGVADPQPDDLGLGDQRGYKATGWPVDKGTSGWPYTPQPFTGPVSQTPDIPFASGGTGFGAPAPTSSGTPDTAPIPFAGSLPSDAIGNQVPPPQPWPTPVGGQPDWSKFPPPPIGPLDSPTLTGGSPAFHPPPQFLGPPVPAGTPTGGNPWGNALTPQGRYHQWRR